MDRDWARMLSLPSLLALVTGTTSLGACAADPGDPLKGTANSAVVSGSGSSGSGGNSSSSSGGNGSSGGSGSSGSGGSGSNGGSGSGSSSSGGSGGSTGSSGGNSGSSSSSSSGSGSSGGSDGGSNGGSSSGSSGADGGVVDASPILPEGGASCVASACPLKVQIEMPNADPKTIPPYLNIVNPGTTPVNLTNVKVHYYFRANGDPSPLVFAVDYAGYYNSGMTGFSAANVMGAFVSMGGSSTAYADTYLELALSGALPAHSTISVNFRIHDAAFNPSFNAASNWSSAFTTTSSTAYVDANYVTAYLSATLAWGIEPGAGPPDAGRPPKDAGGGG